MRHAAALLAACACIGGACAQHAPMFVPGRAQGVRSLTPEQKQERQFLREAAAHLRFQREASKLALAKSGSGHVREVAAALLNHTNTTQPEVEYMLHVRGMAMPLVGNDEVRVLKFLQKASGPRFDRVFLDEVALKANRVDSVQYERIASVTRDPQLQAWVSRHLPTVRYHAALAGRVVAPGAASATNVMGASPSPAMVTRPPAKAPVPKI